MNDSELKQLIELQKTFEQNRRSSAIKRWQRQEHRMVNEMKGGYLSGTTRGRSLTSGLTALITKELDKTIKKKATRKNSNIEQIEAAGIASLMGPEKMLGICIKAILDTLGKEKDIKSCLVITKCASRLRTELYRQVWYEWDSKQMDQLEQKYRNSGVWHKLAAIKVIMGKTEAPSVGDINAVFGNIAFCHAASWVLNAVNRHTVWFQLDTRRVSKNKTVNFIQLTDVFYEWFEEKGAEIETQLMTLYPMLAPPRDWDYHGNGGGYYNPIDKVARLIKDQNGKESRASKKQVDYINAMSKTSHEINPCVHNLQEALFHIEGGQLGSFQPIQFHPETNAPMPDYIDALPMDHPERVEWRRYKGLIKAANNDSRRRGIRSVSNRVAARLFKDIEQFWIPYSCDTRGRTYVLSAGALSPQGSDAERSLLRFHQGASLTPEAVDVLALHLANCYGITDSHDSKREWVEDNKELISAIALDPLEYLEKLESADEPFQFYAACEEYHYCVITGERKETKLPVGIDATASGLQILALLARDKECAEKVNLIPGYNSKQDIYATLLPLVRKHIDLYRDPITNDPAPLHLKKLYIPRKCLKSNLITRVYGSVLQSRKRSIQATITECYNYQRDLLMPGDAMILAKCFEAAMLELAPGALRLFDSILEIGAHCSALAKPATWTTPGGSIVEINPKVNDTRRVDCGWFGQITLADSKLPYKLKKNKVKSSIAPSFVHSLDANILHEAFHDWTKPLVTIHDCVSVRATDVGEALALVLKAYQTVLRDHRTILNNLADANGYECEWNLMETLTDADVDNLVNSEYALC